MDRREFLQLLSLGCAGTLLAACGPKHQSVDEPEPKIDDLSSVEYATDITQHQTTIVLGELDNYQDQLAYAVNLLELTSIVQQERPYLIIGNVTPEIKPENPSYRIRLATLVIHQNGAKELSNILEIGGSGTELKDHEAERVNQWLRQSGIPLHETYQQLSVEEMVKQYCNPQRTVDEAGNVHIIHNSFPMRGSTGSTLEESMQNYELS